MRHGIYLESAKEPAMRTATIAVFAAAFFLATASLRAQTLPPQPPEKIAAAQELLQAMRAPDKFTPMVMKTIDARRVIFETDAIERNPSPDNVNTLMKEYDAMVPSFIEAANPHIKEARDNLLEFYSDQFTLDELHQLTAFYKSPAGQKMLSTQYNLFLEETGIANRIVEAVDADIRKRVDELLH
jgi:uncharacterized protein